MNAVSAYTPLETLLLFQSLAKHGTEESAFDRVSDQLQHNSILRQSGSFDTSRLKPDALKQLYSRLVSTHTDEDAMRNGNTTAGRSEQASTPSSRKRKLQSPPLSSTRTGFQETSQLPETIDRLYARYKDYIVKSIREEETAYRVLQRDIDDIQNGNWDDKFVTGADGKPAVTTARAAQASASLLDRPAKGLAYVESRSVHSPDTPDTSSRQLHQTTKRDGENLAGDESSLPQADDQRAPSPYRRVVGRQRSVSPERVGTYVTSPSVRIGSPPMLSAQLSEKTTLPAPTSRRPSHSPRRSPVPSTTGVAPLSSAPPLILHGDTGAKRISPFVAATQTTSQPILQPHHNRPSPIQPPSSPKTYYHNVQSDTSTAALDAARLSLHDAPEINSSISDALTAAVVQPDMNRETAGAPPSMTPSQQRYELQQRTSSEGTEQPLGLEGVGPLRPSAQPDAARARVTPELPPLTTPTAPSNIPPASYHSSSFHDRIAPSSRRHQTPFHTPTETGAEKLRKALQAHEDGFPSTRQGETPVSLKSHMEATPKPFPPAVSGHAPTAVLHTNGRNTPALNTPSTQTRWKTSNEPTTSPGSPVQPPPSPLSDAGSPLPTGFNGQKAPTREETASRSARGGKTKGISRINTAGARLSRQSQMHSRTRSHSLLSHTEDSHPEYEGRGMAKIKHEQPATPAGFSADDEAGTIDGESVEDALRSGRHRERSAAGDSKPSGLARNHSRGTPDTIDIANIGMEHMGHHAGPRYIPATRNFPRMTGPVLNDITGHKVASLFAGPVKERDAPGYYDLIYYPQDLKSIKSAIAAGGRAVTASVDTAGTPAEGAGSPTPGSSTPSRNASLWIERSTDIMPPKGIVNSAQLEKEIMRMFANAVMFNPDPARGFRRMFKKAKRDTAEHEQTHPGFEEDEGGVVKDTRDMFETVERTVADWRAAERTFNASGDHKPSIYKIKRAESRERMEEMTDDGTGPARDERGDDGAGPAKRRRKA